MRSLFGALRTGLEYKAADISALTWQALLGQPMARSGVSVTIETALANSTVFACLRVLAEGIAMLPFGVYQIAGASKLPLRDHPVDRLIEHAPADWLTSFEWREMKLYHAALTGNAYDYINRVGPPGKKEIVELIPLIPGRCVARQRTDGAIVYDVTDLDGTIKTLPRTDILHLRGPTWRGVMGMDVMRLAREAIGLSIAAEETHAMLHANAAQTGGVIEVAGKLDEPAKERLREAIVKHWSGVRNAFKTIVLDAGQKFTPREGMTGVDAQFLETRKFQVEEICRMLRVFPQMIGHADKAPTFASAEAFFIAHVVHSLMPWGRRLEQTTKRDLLAGEPDLITRISYHELMRGDSKAQSEYFSKALGAGGSPAWMTQDEVRDRCDLNPLGGTASQLPTPTNPAIAPGPADPSQGDDAHTE